MLDVLDRPSFINPMGAANPNQSNTQGLIQPQPVAVGLRTMEMDPHKKRGLSSEHKKMIISKGAPSVVESGVTSMVTSIGPSVSQVEEGENTCPPVPNVYEVHDPRYKKKTNKGRRSEGATPMVPQALVAPLK